MSRRIFSSSLLSYSWPQEIQFHMRKLTHANVNVSECVNAKFKLLTLFCFDISRCFQQLLTVNCLPTSLKKKSNSSCSQSDRPSTKNLLCSISTLISVQMSVRVCLSEQQPALGPVSGQDVSLESWEKALPETDAIKF